jgi:hypothetical protein
VVLLQEAQENQAAEEEACLAVASVEQAVEYPEAMTQVAYLAEEEVTDSQQVWELVVAGPCEGASLLVLRYPEQAAVVAMVQVDEFVVAAAEVDSLR